MSESKGKSERIHIFEIVIAVFFLSYFFSFLLAQSPKIEAATGGQIYGYAWSETIGWISFNCADLGTCGTSNYYVNIDGSGNLTGYAWSENIGWIKFGGLNTFPSGGNGTQQQNANINGINLKGWVRACAGTASGDCSTMTSRTDGWDGWISLSGAGYGVSKNGTAYSGYAWGSDVVGWIDFSTILNYEAPSCTITFDKNPLQRGVDMGTNIHWTSLNASTFNINGIGNVAPNTSSSQFIAIPDAPTTDYSGTVTGLFNSSASCPATLAVVCSTVPYCVNAAHQQGAGPGYDIIAAPSADCSVAYGQPCVSPAYCSPNSSICLYPIPVIIAHLQLKPSLVNAGDTIQVYWKVSNVASCSVTGDNGDAWSVINSDGVFDSGLSGQISSPIQKHTTYTLSCTGLDGSQVGPESQNVDIIPAYQEK